MSEGNVIAGVIQPTAIPALSATEKRQRWFELGLVLLVSCATPTANAIYLLIHGPNSVHQLSVPGNARWAMAMVHEIAGLCLLAYVLSRSGRGFAANDGAVFALEPIL